MATLFIYSIKAALCMVAFYFAYKILLSRDTFHRFNRIAILASLVLSLLLPLIKVDTVAQNGMAKGMVVLEHIVVMSAGVSEESHSLSAAQWGFAIYLLGVLLFVIREAVSIVRLLALIKRSKAVNLPPSLLGATQESADGKTAGKSRIIVAEGDVSPFSWFNYVVISEKDYRENPREIIIHELAHVRLAHSWDVAFCNIIIVLQWFNPAAWLLKQELQNIHEYEADEAVIKKGVDARQYQILLIRKSVGEHLFSVANNLNYNSLKKRITMMKKTRTNPWQRAKALAVLPIAAVAVAAFASPKVEQAMNKVEVESEGVINIVTNKVAAAASQQSPQEAVDAAVNAGVELGATRKDSVNNNEFYNPEVMPEFPGGIVGFNTFIANNIKYPESAAEARIEGRVVISFVISKEGDVQNPVVLRGVSPELDAEALHVVRSMPKWTPGMQAGKPVNTRYAVPIVFRLPDDKADKTTTESVSTDNANVTYYIDGKLVKGEELTKFTTEKMNDIKEMKVVNELGREGNKSTVSITTK
ncbi:MAG: M56 family metallopeptidase [Prevotella sp.]|uniref:TonB family protein n=1 Tax=Prevotella sp. TaxID=59823 RepID=UPI002A253322|nr:TonB family protein [Prevotella sp.]MDD7319134.1 M56 family metallopeptidase [Prevotellaceae bacterium]MDY4019591.1 M56 family metallopeptidase [Prevotella sp.]